LGAFARESRGRVPPETVSETNVCVLSTWVRIPWVTVEIVSTPFLLSGNMRVVRLPEIGCLLAWRPFRVFRLASKEFAYNLLMTKWRPMKTRLVLWFVSQQTSEVNAAAQVIDPFSNV